MMDIRLNGTQGVLPSMDRHLSSACVSCGGSTILFDCGEGTQIAARKAGISLSRIDLICLTHFHGDHVLGLPGLLMTMGSMGRTEPVVIAGPAHIEQLVRCLCVVAPLSFPLQTCEVRDGMTAFEKENLSVTAFSADHSIPCLGYTVQLKRTSRFLPDKAEALQIPKKYWSLLQKGESVRFSHPDTGKEILVTPSMVLGDPRPGLKVCYCTDSRPTRHISRAVRGADLLICEGMYGGHDWDDKAKERGHMSIPEAAELARRAEAKRLWLTHYSPALGNPEEFMEEARSIFPAAEAGFDGKSLILSYPE